jgi:hypothetical protein
MTAKRGLFLEGMGTLEYVHQRKGCACG